MLYTPMLPEAASGTLEPRHVVVPLRLMCPHAELLLGRATALDDERAHRHVETRRRVHVDSATSSSSSRSARSRARCRFPASPSTPSASRSSPTRSTCATTCCGELEAATAASIDDQRRRAPRLSSSSAPATRASRLSPSSPTSSATRCATTRACATASAALGPRRRGRRRSCRRSRPSSASTPRSELSRRGVDIRVGTTLESVEPHAATSPTASRIPTRTLVWTAGVRANPLLERLGLPLDDRGRVLVDPTLRVEGVTHVWALGDGARVPNEATPGSFDPPTCQHALRQARRLAKNLTGEREALPLPDARPGGDARAATRESPTWSASASAASSAGS